MTFEKFVEIAKETIKDYLPAKYYDANVNVYPHEKLNENYLGMTVRMENQMVSPVINLNMFYEQMQGTQMDMEDTMRQMTEVVQITPMDINIDILDNYEKVKRKLFIRVSDADRNQEMLSKIPHICIENLAITYHIFADFRENGIASTTVTNEMIKFFGVSNEQLHKDAMESSVRLFPAVITSLDEKMKDYVREEMEMMDFSQEDIEHILNEIFEEETKITIVTNEHTFNGAASLFYPGQMDKIAERLGGDYFILPSSVHEMLIYPDTGEMTSNELKRMVMEVNGSEVRPEDKLTDEVYHYDRINHIFESAITYEDKR